MQFRKVLYVVEAVVRFVVILFCLGGFVWMCWEQMDKFLSRKTSIATSWVSRDPNVIPNIVFCPHRGFKKQGAPPDVADRAEYDAMTADVDFFLGGLSTTEYSTLELLANTTKDVYTVYNGKCKMLEIITPIQFKKYVYLRLSSKEPLDIYIMNPGDELYLIWQHFTETGIATVPIRDHMQVELQQEEYVSISTSHSPCDDSIQHADYTRCVNKELLRHIREKGATCVPLPVSKFLLERSGLPECAGRNKSEAVRVNSIVALLLSKASNMACVRSCTAKTFKIQASHLTYMDDSPWVVPGYCTVFLALASPLAILSEEYLVYDFIGIVSAVGGGLGLFLGWSFMGVMYSFIEALMKRAKTKKVAECSLDPAPGHIVVEEAK